MLFRVYRGSKVYWKDCYVRVERKGFFPKVPSDARL